MRLLPRITIAAVVAGCLAATAQSATKTLEFPRFKIEHGSLDKEGLPVSGASLCLVAKEHTCFTMPDWRPKDSYVVYQFGLEPRVERLKIAGGGSLVFFSATFSGGGSGLATRLAVLRYEANGAILNLLPDHYVTGQSDFAMWDVPESSSFPLLVTADADWEDGETHFAHHHYDVEVYRFDPKADRYTKVVSYRTKKKYPGLDDVATLRVLKPERDEIMKRLKALP